VGVARWGPVATPSKLDFNPIYLFFRAFFEPVSSFCLFLNEKNFEDSVHFGPGPVTEKYLYLVPAFENGSDTDTIYMYCIKAAKNPYFFLLHISSTKGYVPLQVSLQKHVLLLIKAKNS
jgi:hypothetical protein